MKSLRHVHRWCASTSRQRSGTLPGATLSIARRHNGLAVERAVSIRGPLPARRRSARSSVAFPESSDPVVIAAEVPSERPSASATGCHPDERRRTVVWHLVVEAEPCEPIDRRLPPLAEHLDQALLLLDERVDAGGLAVEVVGDGALLLQWRHGIGRLPGQLLRVSVRTCCDAAARMHWSSQLARGSQQVVA